MPTKQVVVKTQGKNVVIQDEMTILFQQAIEKGSAVEVMERLMAIRTQLRQEKAEEEYNKALSAFQAECPIIGKSKKAQGQKGFGYTYAPLEVIVEQVKELLGKYGFSYSFDTTYEKPEGQARMGSLVITCNVKHISGGKGKAEFRAVIDTEGFMTDVQKAGSSLTYGARYSFKEAFGIMTGDEDNDGTAETKTPKTSSTPASKINTPAGSAEDPNNVQPKITPVQLKQIEVILGRQDLTDAEVMGLKPYKTYTEAKAKQVIEYFAKKGAPTGKPSASTPASKTNTPAGLKQGENQKPDGISDAQKKLIKERIQSSHLLYNQKDEDATNWEGLGAEPETVDEVAKFKQWFEDTLKDNEKEEMTLVIATWIGDSKRKIQSLHDKLTKLESELRSN